MSIDLQQRIRGAVPLGEIERPDSAEVWRRGRRQRRRRRVTAVVTAVAVLFGVGSAVVSLARVERDAPVISGDHATEGWSTMPEAPIVGRGRHGAAWTGREVVVWGGMTRDFEFLADGAAFEAASASWRALPPAPLEGRASPDVVWTGEEILIVGGHRMHGRSRDGGAEVVEVPYQVVGDEDGLPAGGSSETHYTDGAAYHPATDSWRSLAVFPLQGRAATATAWTGEELIIWGGVAALSSGPRPALGDGAAYDPDTDTWRILPPAPLAARGGAVAVWTGQELIVFGGTAEADTGGGAPPDLIAFNDGAAYNPTSNTWRRIADGPAQHAAPGFDPLAAVWTGERMLVWMGQQAAAYDPTTDRWEQLPAWPGQSHQVSPEAVWTGSELLTWSGWQEGDDSDGGPSDAGHALTSAGTWRSLAPAPIPARDDHSLTWTGNALVIWGGTVEKGGFLGLSGDNFSDTADGAIYHPGSGASSEGLRDPG